MKDRLIICTSFRGRKLFY